MTWTYVIEHILILIGSYITGIIVYALMSRAHVNDRKARISWLNSMVFQLVIYVWIAKGIVLFPRLVNDPLAVLAYPSSTAMLYIALLFLAIHLFVHIHNNVLPIRHMIEVFVPVLMSTQFVYVFIQYIQTKQTPDLLNVSILFGIMMISVVVRKVHTPNGYMILFVGWAMAKMIGSLLLSRGGLFGYTVSPILFAVCIVLAGWTGWKMKFEREF